MREAGALRVLVVDDDPTQLSLLERTLRLEGFEVTTATGAIGVSALVRRCQPDLVLLDVNIPALSGDRLLEVVRRHAPPDTKLVLYSACDEAHLRRLASDVQADGYISKSTAALDLAERIRRLCASQRRKS